jgi:hypothetical protein
MDDNWCKGELKGDPDIAGVGVVSSILTTTGLMIIFSWLLWYLAVWHGKTTLNSRLYRALTKSAFILADIQLVTALAVTCSSIILIHTKNETSLYHVFVARCLAQANFAGYGAALTLYNREQSKWSIRLVLLLCALALFNYCSIISVGEFRNWGSHTPSCFYSDSRIRYWHPFWMHFDIGRQVCAFLIILAEATECFGDTFDPISKGAVMALEDVSNDLSKWSWQRPFTAAITTLIMAILQLISAFVVSIYSVLPPSPAPFAATVFFLWYAYEIRCARQANQHILVAYPTSSEPVSLYNNDNPEQDWGFGQLLPLFLLLLPILQMVDIFADEAEQPRHTSRNYTPGASSEATPAQSDATGISTSAQDVASSKGARLRTGTGFQAAPMASDAELRRVAPRRGSMQ